MTTYMVEAVATFYLEAESVEEAKKKAKAECNEIEKKTLLIGVEQVDYDKLYVKTGAEVNNENEDYIDEEYELVAGTGVIRTVEKGE